jgi:hypothetical protein
MKVTLKLYLTPKMNPLLGRLYENRTKSKTKHTVPAAEEHRRNHSFDRALVPKIGTKVKLDALPEPLSEKRLSTLARTNIGKLPTLPTLANHQTTQDVRERRLSHVPSIRNRKLSNSIKEMEVNFFPTEFDAPRITEPP